jgi:NADPH:quinone reductase-like Zn-dependent oxidoreductase
MLASRQRRADIERLAELIETGQVTPVVDRAYPLSEAAEAMRYLVAGHARGKIVITIPAEVTRPLS